MSTLSTLLFFVGIPLLAFALITLLVMAPSLAKGPADRPGQDWDAQSAWIGAVPPGHDAVAGRQLGQGATSRPHGASAAPVDGPDDSRAGERDTGGSRARW